MKSEILKDAVKQKYLDGFTLDIKLDDGRRHEVYLPEPVIDKILEWRDKEYAKQGSYDSTPAPTVCKCGHHKEMHSEHGCDGQVMRNKFLTEKQEQDKFFVDIRYAVVLGVEGDTYRLNEILRDISARLTKLEQDKYAELLPEARIREICCDVVHDAFKLFRDELEKGGKE